MNTSSLSFREHAAITLCASSKGLGGLTVAGAVAQAQRLSEECCAKWGHEEPNSLGTHRVCSRCGAEVSR